MKPLWDLWTYFYYDVENYCKPNVYEGSIKGAIQVNKKEGIPRHLKKEKNNN